MADGKCCRLRIMGLVWLMASLGVVSLEDQLVTMLCFEAIADNAANWPSSFRDTIEEILCAGKAGLLPGCRFDHMPVLFVD